MDIVKTLKLLSAAVVVAICGCNGDHQPSPALTYNTSRAKELRKLLQKGSQGEEAAAVSAAEPTGFANFRGKFTLSGTAPQRSPLKVDKDLEVCAPAGMQILDESVVVGPGNGLKNVLLFVSSAVPADDPKWIHEDYAALREQQAIFDQKNCVFLSHVASMWAVQEMKVLNSDPVGHNTNLDSKRGAAAGNFTVPANSSAIYVPGKASPAPFSVSCSIHPWMKAWLMVCDSPFFAVTADDGSFEIKNLPAGVPLEFRVWQESAGFLQKNVTVDGEPAKWNKGRFVLTLEDGSDKEMNVVVDAALFQ